MARRSASGPRRERGSPITRFEGEWRWLSNFWPSPVVVEGTRYPTIEHAYQAMKTLALSDRTLIRQQPTPGAAKKQGQMVPVREDWDEIKLSIMEQLVRDKFERHGNLRNQLVATYPRPLLEGNDWGDQYWGVFEGIGANHLGRILMRVRSDLVAGDHGAVPAAPRPWGRALARRASRVAESGARRLTGRYRTGHDLRR